MWKRRLALTALSLLAALSAQSAQRWIDVPFIKQEKNGCGAASISMLMQYWAREQGRPLSPVADANTIQQALYSASDHGIKASAVQAYFRNNGYSVFAFSGEWRDLAEHIAKGRPLLVALRPLGNGKELHYVVVVGVDEERQLVIANDPAERKLLPFDREGFEKAWTVTGHWTLLAVPAPTH